MVLSFSLIEGVTYRPHFPYSHLQNVFLSQHPTSMYLHKSDNRDCTYKSHELPYSPRHRMEDCPHAVCVLCTAPVGTSVAFYAKLPGEHRNYGSNIPLRTFQQPYGVSEAPSQVTSRPAYIVYLHSGPVVVEGFFRPLRIMNPTLGDACSLGCSENSPQVEEICHRSHTDTEITSAM